MDVTTHSFFKLMYVLDGVGHVRSKRGDSAIGRGDLVAVAPGMPHHIVDDARAPLALIVHCIQPAVIDMLQEKDARERFPELRVLRQDALSQEARRVLRQIMFEQSLPRPSSAGMITGLTLQLLAAVLRAFAGRTNGGPQDLAVAGAPASRVHAYLRDLET